MKFIGTDSSALDVQVQDGKLVMACWGSSGMSVIVRLNDSQCRILADHLQRVANKGEKSA